MDAAERALDAEQRTGRRVRGPEVRGSGREDEDPGREARPEPAEDLDLMTADGRGTRGRLGQRDAEPFEVRWQMGAQVCRVNGSPTLCMSHGDVAPAGAGPPKRYALT